MSESLTDAYRSMALDEIDMLNLASLDTRAAGNVDFMHECSVMYRLAVESILFHFFLSGSCRYSVGKEERGQVQ